MDAREKLDAVSKAARHQMLKEDFQMALTATMDRRVQWRV